MPFAEHGIDLDRRRSPRARRTGRRRPGRRRCRSSRACRTGTSSASCRRAHALKVTRSANPLIGRSDVVPAKAPFVGSAAPAAAARPSVAVTASVIASLRIGSTSCRRHGRQFAAREHDSPARAGGSTRTARHLRSRLRLGRGSRGRRPPPRRRRRRGRRTSAGERTPPAASTASPDARDRLDELEVGAGERPVAVDRGAQHAGDAGLEAELDRALARQARLLRPARRCGRSRRGRRARRRAARRAPPPTAPGRGTRRCRRPRGRRRRRGARGRPRASGCRPRPGGGPGGGHPATRRTSSGRARPLRAPSRSTRWIRGGARRGEPARRAPPGRRRARRPRRSRPGGGARRPRRGRRRPVSPRSADSSQSDSTAPC